MSWRRNIVVLIDGGLRYLVRIQRHTELVQSELLGPLDAAERRQLRVLPAKLLDGHAPQPA